MGKSYNCGYRDRCKGSSKSKRGDSARKSDYTENSERYIKDKYNIKIKGFK